MPSTYYNLLQYPNQVLKMAADKF